MSLTQRAGDTAKNNSCRLFSESVYEFVSRTLLPFLAVPPLEPIGHDVARVRDGEVGVVPVANMPVPRPHHQRDTYRRRRGPVWTTRAGERTPQGSFQLTGMPS